MMFFKCTESLEAGDMLQAFLPLPQTQATPATRQWLCVLHVYAFRRASEKKIKKQ